MCNLSSGIEERGIEIGIDIGFEQGVEQGIEKGKVELIESMLRKGYKAELISKMTDISLEKIKKVSEDVMLVV